jgi:hypothetical protein
MQEVLTGDWLLRISTVSVSSITSGGMGKEGRRKDETKPSSKSILIRDHDQLRAAAPAALAGFADVRLFVII